VRKIASARHAETVDAGFGRNGDFIERLLVRPPV
jgi:hypothetical protein